MQLSPWSRSFYKDTNQGKTYNFCIWKRKYDKLYSSNGCWLTRPFGIWPLLDEQPSWDHPEPCIKLLTPTGSICRRPVKHFHLLQVITSKVGLLKEFPTQYDIQFSETLLTFLYKKGHAVTEQVGKLCLKCIWCPHHYLENTETTN